ncbi:MAG TPA: hypothetical protein VM328_01475, partial [Fimbriimonadaceae bacterium]|nr:hypothetical protein [Fimbriimonadaceae bacterium]
MRLMLALLPALLLAACGPTPVSQAPKRAPEPTAEAVLDRPHQGESPAESKRVMVVINEASRDSLEIGRY